MAVSHAPRYFWRTHDPRISVAPFTVDGVSYINAEQYMMASKARLFPGNAAVEAQIMKTTSARTMTELGRKVASSNNNDWMANCYRMVYVGNHAKFSQDPKLHSYLLGTGDAELIEASPFDRLYGIGYAEDNVPADRGMNYLGRVLMDVRDLLRRESTRLSLLSTNSPVILTPRIVPNDFHFVFIVSRKPMTLVVVQQYVYMIEGSLSGSYRLINGVAVAESLTALFERCEAKHTLQSSMQTSAADSHGGILTITTWNFVSKA